MSLDGLIFIFTMERSSFLHSSLGLSRLDTLCIAIFLSREVRVLLAVHFAAMPITILILFFWTFRSHLNFISAPCKSIHPFDEYVPVHYRGWSIKLTRPFWARCVDRKNPPRFLHGRENRPLSLPLPPASPFILLMNMYRCTTGGDLSNPHVPFGLAAGVDRKKTSTLLQHGRENKWR